MVVNKDLHKKNYISTIVDECDMFDCYENSKLIHYKDLPQSFGKDTYTLEEYSSVAGGRAPYCMQRSESGELLVTACEPSHALIIGATGSGKTQSILLNEAELLARSQDKPSMVITDAKEEIYPLLAARFKKEGYKIKKLDCCNYESSDRFNPLTPIFRCYQEYLHVCDKVDVVEVHGVKYNRFNGVVYSSQEALDRAIKTAEDALLSVMESKIDEISEIICSVKDGKRDEWREGARSIFKGILYGMLEDSVPNERGLDLITEDTYTLNTLLNIFDIFGGKEDYDKGYFSKRDNLRSKAYFLAEKYLLIPAENTRSGYVSTLSSCLAKIRDMAIRHVTCANTIDFEELDDGKQPVVIFIIFKDETDSYDYFVSMFLSRLYTALIEMVRKNGKPRSVPFYFLLDEFGNLPAFPNFDKVTSLGRGRNVWFWVVLQSYAQLNEVYGGKATTIKNNLNMHIYLGTNDLETKKAFSDECGMHTIISPVAILGGDDSVISNHVKETIPLVPVSRLAKLPAGECVITRMNADVVWSRFERHYTCPEFRDALEPYVHESGFEQGDSRYDYDIGEMIARIKANAPARRSFNFDF